MNKTTKVSVKPAVLKSLSALPKHIVAKLLAWVEMVETEGLNKAKKIPGYRDEALKGNRKGQRSIRLNKAYRAIYTVNRGGFVDLIYILEVNKHEY